MEITTEETEEMMKGNYNTIIRLDNTEDQLEMRVKKYINFIKSKKKTPKTTKK